MNYFKLRTLVIILILVMLSFLFTYIYINGNYFRLPTEIEIMKQSPGALPLKVFNQHSHRIVNNISSLGDKKQFQIGNQEQDSNTSEKYEENHLKDIPNEKDIPIINNAQNVHNQENLLKQQQVLKQQQQQQLNTFQQEKQEHIYKQQVETGEQQHLVGLNVPINKGNTATKTIIGETVANGPPKPVAPQPCNRLWVKGKSKWFDERFNGAISSVWTRDNIRQSPDVTNWWLKLQGSKNKDVVGVMESAFKMIPDVDVYKDRSTCRRCAVVGNSGNLRGSKYGSHIDAHDMVIRMNEAPVTNFEEDVGYRETHRLMYPESFFNIKPDVHFVLVSFKTLDVEWLVSAMTTGTIKRTWRPVKNLIKVNASLVQIYNPALMKQAHEVWNLKHGRYPSTGLLAIMFALHACDEVDVYGYGANKIGNWDHYWQNDGGRGNSAFRKTGVHNSDVEKEIYTKLNSEGIITLHMGNAHK
ncbi:CMP-N-acetylneuraminate-beta-galactosamide-alpha-2,3-sialyltransferase 2-like [Anneissia japonica]|uniref:CMP-N-acetylneuraminate-beta-galactosamide- alpha-2,3-sialyltransferase 2-like n=1 Tax=Anneissia japonica TaxID=1529436 RepID=UPI001425A0CC|nr:CMP-N-acetylneuraminate-beta-galactosamide-alpha-2,3-sialyltransferase 2-like [Anneissia japonica]